MRKRDVLFVERLLLIAVVSAALVTALRVRAEDRAEDLAEDRSAAMAALLDSPRPREVVDEGLRIAEALRRHYGIDSGHRHADRLAAARRAKTEVLDRLVFTPDEVRRAAADLGYDIDPARCANFCGNVDALARVELAKRALRALAQDGVQGRSVGLPAECSRPIVPRTEEAQSGS